MKATAPCFSHRCLIPSLWSARLREVKCTTHTFTTLPALALSAYLHPSTREENSPVSAYSLSLRPRTFFCVHTVILDMMMSFPVDASSTRAGLSSAVGGQHAAQHICKPQRSRTNTHTRPRSLLVQAMKDQHCKHARSRPIPARSTHTFRHRRLVLPARPPTRSGPW